MRVFRRHFLAFQVSEADPTVFAGPLDQASIPPYAEIMAEMSERPFAFGLVPRFVVLRDYDHAPSWLDWYTRLQIQLFRRDLDPRSKRLAVAINRSQDWSVLAVAFRLSTQGVAGYTQYRVFARRIAQDLFACRE